MLHAAQVRFWLIGGQAAELVCGRELRPHDDLDFFLRAEDAERAVKRLLGVGFTPAHGSLDQGALFLKRGELLCGLVPIWPGPHAGNVGRHWVASRTARPVRGGWRAHPDSSHAVGMKQVVPGFYRLPLREKDLLDVAALRSLPEPTFSEML